MQITLKKGLNRQVLLLGYVGGGVILGASLIIAGIIINIATNNTGSLLGGQERSKFMRVFKIPYENKREEKIFGGYISLRQVLYLMLTASTFTTKA